jgi:hypothetical protein
MSKYITFSTWDLAPITHKVSERERCFPPTGRKGGIVVMLPLMILNFPYKSIQ